jgi:arginyl-tRNA---protein transferase
LALQDGSKKKKFLPEPAHKFTVTLEPDAFTHEKYTLFQNYQRHVHHEPATESGFRGFLCNSPLVRTPRTTSNLSETDKKPDFGSYHLVYRLDGDLVAISVIDILPHCVSAVYFLYKQEFAEFSLGKVSAVREILLAQELDLPYYYMGYWIPRCPKMEYKLDYKPTEVLDYFDLSWKFVSDKEKKWLDENHWIGRFPKDGESDDKLELVQKSDESPEDMEVRYSEGASIWDVDFGDALSERDSKEIDFEKMGIAIQGRGHGEVSIYPVTVSF